MNLQKQTGMEMNTAEGRAGVQHQLMGFAAAGVTINAVEPEHFCAGSILIYCASSVGPVPAFFLPIFAAKRAVRTPGLLANVIQKHQKYVHDNELINYNIHLIAKID